MSGSSVRFDEGLRLDEKFKEYVKTRCALGDVDACFVSTIWELIGDKVVAYSDEDRTLSIMSIDEGTIGRVPQIMRELGFDVDVVGKFPFGFSEVLIRLRLGRRSDTVAFAKGAVLLRVGNHTIPLMAPGFLSIRSDGSIGGTVIAPRWLLPKQCFTYVNGTPYTRVRGIGNFSVDALGLLVPTRTTQASTECDPEPPDSVDVRFVIAHSASFSILYNGFVAFKWRHADLFVWTNEFMEALSEYRVGEYNYRHKHYINKATKYRLRIDELLGILHRIREKHPRSRITELIDEVEALRWYRDNTKDLLTAMRYASITKS